MFTPKTINLSHFTLRVHQTAFLDHVLPRIHSDETGKKYLYSSPTGSGKSLMFLSVVARDPYAWGITPRIEIISDMLTKCGGDVKGLSTEAIVDLALQYRITTPIRMRNMLAKGTFPVEPRNIWRLVCDECHHFPASTYGEILAYIPWVSVVGLTATPFRGTPKGTKEFLDMWDEYTPIMNIPQASELGFISVPEFEIWPLVDDDLITVVNGDFSASASADATASRYTELVDRIESAGMVGVTPYFEPQTADDSPPHRGEVEWNVPTLFAVSTTEQANTLAEYLNSANMPATAITQGTSRTERSEAFAACLRGETAIVQIDVVSEGVDLAIRRIIDLRPTFSPVRWLQLVGRATRPGGVSTYICCCRNIERHAYLFEGMIPSATIAAAQQAFGSPSARSGSRVVGIEGLGRFQAASVHFADNTVGAIYCLYSVEGAHKREFGVVLHPASAEPIYAEKISTMKEDGTRDWGKWKAIEAIPDVQGFASTPPKTVTDKQKESYTRSGRRWGLNTQVEVDRKSIQAYFILRDLYPNGFKL